MMLGSSSISPVRLASNLVLGFTCTLFPVAGSISYSQEVASQKSKQPSDAASPEEIASRALDYLRKEGQRWIDRRECVSCHQIPAMVWSLNVAKQNGLPVEANEVDELAEWSTDYLHFVETKDRAEAECDDVLQKNTDTMAALLLALPQYGGKEKEVEQEQPAAESCDAEKAPKPGTNWRKQFTASLIQNQNEDGSWDPKGQLPSQKRDPEETRRASTLWITIALLQEGIPQNDFRFGAALDLIDNTTQTDWEAESAEWWAARLLLSRELGQTSQQKRIRDALVSKQQDDGGWGWLLADESDALATGLVLYALKNTGAEDDSSESVQDAIRSATKFLAKTQQANGSWKVPGTKKNSRNRSVPTSNYWGTAWAVIGLLAEPE
ncbi:MAG: prenyltransferase/squalene oxidase repeat-containing protein [Planctomycetota bacterium]